MLSSRQKRFEILVILLLAALLSTAVFWFLRAPSRHTLAALQFIVIIAFAGLLLGFSAKCSLRFTAPNAIACTVFVVSSALLLICIFLQWFSLVTTALSLFVSSFLPGYVITRFTRISPSKSYINTIVLSYVLSIPITAVIGTIVFLNVGEEFRELALAIFYFLMSLPVPLLISRGHANGFRIHSNKIAVKIIDVLFLFMIGTVFLLFIGNFYPLMAHVPSRDIARLFGSVQQTMRAPETLSSIYPWFNFYETVFFVLGKPSVEVFHTSLALSSFIMILAFHMMASKYLRKIDQRLPVVATTFWSIFGGFGWLVFFKETMFIDEPFFALLRSANEASYIDISIPRVWFWFRPMVLGITLLFVLLYLLKRQDIPTGCFRLAYSILVASLALFHIPELAILVVVLSALSFFFPHVDLRLKDAIGASIIGLAAATMISFSLYQNTRLIESIPYLEILGLILPLSFSYVLVRANWKRVKVFKKLGDVLIYVLIVVYIAGTLTWLAENAFSRWMVQEILFVPWLLYPVRLGLIGLLGLLGVLYMKKHRKDGVVLFVCMLFSTLVFARLLSYVNINFINTGFYEQRVIQPALLPATSVLAALGMKPILVRFSSSRHLNMRRAVLIAITSSLIVVVGTTSTLLAYDFVDELSRRNVIGDNELVSVEFLLDALNDNPRSPILTMTEKSMTVVDLSGPIFAVEPLRLPAWSSINPEIPLIVLFRGDPQFTAPYIYLHERDKDAIAQCFHSGLLLEKVIPMLPSIYRNENVELYKIPEGSPPVMNSSTVLLVPDGYQTVNRSVLQVFLSLSFGGYEYTTMLDSDTSALKKDIIIVPTDATSVVVDNLIARLGNFSHKKLIVFNSIGWGPIGKDLFFWENASKKVSVNLIEGVNNLPLPFDVNVTSTSAKENVEVLSWFSGEDEKVPFAGRRVVNEVEVIYVNLYPLFSEMALRSMDDAAALLGVLLDTVELGLEKFSMADFKLEDLLLFEDASLEGEITVGTNSVVFASTEKIRLRLEGEHEIYNVSSISLTGTNDIVMKTDCARIGEGIGFYTKLMLGDTTFELNGEEIRMEARLENDEIVQLNGSSTIEFHTQEPTSVYARTPTLSITGKTTFQEAYGLHKIYKELRTSGQTLRSIGNFNFTILVSDVYTIAKDLSWRGSVQRDPPILQWNELKSLQESIPWFALAIITVFMSDRIMAFWEKKNRREA